MGDGDDSFTWDPGDGSDTVEGQGGKDVMDFHGSNAPERISLSANGSRVRLFRDVAAVTMDLNGVDAVNVDTLGGADTVTVGDLTGTDLSAANVDLSGTPAGGGDGQADSVVVDGTAGPDNVDVGSNAGAVVVSGLASTVNVTGSEPGQDLVDVNALAGDDRPDVGGGRDRPVRDRARRRRGQRHRDLQRHLRRGHDRSRQQRDRGRARLRRVTRRRTRPGSRTSSCRVSAATTRSPRATGSRS